MIPYGFDFDVLDRGATKKEMGSSAASGSLVKIGGTDAPSTSQSFQETNTYSPTTTSVYAPQVTRTSSYAPVYAPSISVIEGSAGATLTKKDTIAGGTEVAPSAAFPISAGGTSVSPSAGFGSNEALSPANNLIAQGPAVVLVAGVVIVGGVILFSRFGKGVK